MRPEGAAHAGIPPVDRTVGRLVPGREAFEAWKLKQGGHYMSRNNAPGSDLNGYQDAYTQGQWEAWQAAMAAERERCLADCEAVGDLGATLVAQRIRDRA